jgi:FkbM family methyltransferase
LDKSNVFGREKLSPPACEAFFEQEQLKISLADMFSKLKSFSRMAVGLKSDTEYFSQAGEDAIAWKIARYVLNLQRGFYVDVGAYHPYKHSNTYLLYKAGWRGINIDPRPGMKALFERYRAEDINIEAGIAEQEGEMTYYIIDDDSTMNTFSRENLVRLNLLDQVRQKVPTPVHRLDEVLDRHSGAKEVDYLNIDAEGFESEILNSLDVGNHRPKMISIEQNDVLTLKDVINSDTSKLLESHSYSGVAKNILLADVATVFYLRNDCLPKS